jgi:homocitrate synthase
MRTDAMAQTTEMTAVLKHFRGVVDSTLREGLQFSRADFTPAQQKTIVRHLDRIGVEYIEVGNPAGEETAAMIRELAALPRTGRAKVLCHIRNRASDLERALACGIDGVNLLCTADPERLASMRMSEEAYLGVLEDNILAAHAHGLEVRVSVEDFFNQPRDFSLAAFALAERLSVSRIGLADTLGKALCWDVFRRIEELRERFRTDLEVHFHNDLGHAVGNALAALSAGANWVDTTLLGIGERTGITALSSFLLNLYLLDPGFAERYDLGFLTRAENDVSDFCRMETPVNLMTNTATGFAHKAGIHLNAISRFGPHKYESLAPQVIGNRRLFITGSPVSGRTAREDLRDAPVKPGRGLAPGRR